MKKQMCFLMVLVIISGSILLASAETAAQKEFDYTVFKNLDGFKYDKFEDTWSYYNAYVEKYADASVIIGIQVDGDDEYLTMAPVFYVKIVDPKSNQPLYTVKSVDLIIDDTKYSYSKMLETSGSSGVILGENGKKMVQAFAKCKQVSIKISLEYSSLTLDLKQNQVETTLKEISKQLIKANIWDFLDDSSTYLFESIYPLTIK